MLYPTELRGHSVDYKPVELFTKVPLGTYPVHETIHGMRFQKRIHRSEVRFILRPSVGRREAEELLPGQQTTSSIRKRASQSSCWPTLILRQE
jgi:hypothetical protein